MNKRIHRVAGILAIILTLGSCNSEGDLDENKIAQSKQAVVCSPSWVLIETGRNACYIDKDNQIYGYKLELNVADKYRDSGGCYPDSYVVRLYDTVRCVWGTSVYDCLGIPPTPPISVGVDNCPKPRKEEFFGTISASPTTVNIYDGRTSGSSNICWDTKLDSAQVKVGCNGTTETLFAADPKGCQVANWITPGASCTFTVYGSSSATTSFAEVTVTGVEVSGPKPCPTGQDHHCDPDFCYFTGRTCP